MSKNMLMRGIGLHAVIASILALVVAVGMIAEHIVSPAYATAAPTIVKLEAMNNTAGDVAGWSWNFTRAAQGLNIGVGDVATPTTFSGWSGIDGGKIAVGRKNQFGHFIRGFTGTDDYRGYADSYGRFYFSTDDGHGVEGQTFQFWPNETALDISNEYVVGLGSGRSLYNFVTRIPSPGTYNLNDGPKLAQHPKQSSSVNYRNSDFEAGYNGIEKTFDTYDQSVESEVVVDFSTGFTSDWDGDVAHYCVKVIAIQADNSETAVYDKCFNPKTTVDNADMKVRALSYGSGSAFYVERNMDHDFNIDAVEKSSHNFTVGTVGHFTSKGAVLPAGSTSYKVQITPDFGAVSGINGKASKKVFVAPLFSDLTVQQTTDRRARAYVDTIKTELANRITAITTPTYTPDTTTYNTALATLNTGVASTAMYADADYVSSEKLAQLARNLTTEVEKLEVDFARAQAKENLAAKATEYEGNISGTSYLTDEEKAALVQQVTDAKSAGNAALDAATTDEAIYQAKDDALAAIAGVTIPAQAQSKKGQASTTLETAAETARQNVRDNAALTMEEKTEALDAINQALTDAKDAIANQTTDQGVADKLAEGQNAISDAGTVAHTTKADAHADVARAADAAKAGVSADLTGRADIIAAIDAAKAAADRAIDDATTNDGVASARADGLLAIAQQDALAQLQKTVAEKKAHIDANDSLVDSDRARAEAAVDEQLSIGEDAIRSATSTDGVTSALSDAKNNVSSVAEIGTKALRDELGRESVTKAGVAYTQADNKQAYDSAVADAKRVLADGFASQDAIDAATTALTAARVALNGADKLAQAQESAVNTINNFNGLTDEQKAGFTQRIRNAATVADVETVAREANAASTPSAMKDYERKGMKLASTGVSLSLLVIGAVLSLAGGTAMLCRPRRRK